MTTTQNADATPSTPLLTATRLLSGLHALAGVGLLGLAGYSFLQYRDAPDDEALAGLALVFGAGQALLGLVLLVLGVAGAYVRSTRAVYTSGLAAGLFVIGITGLGSFLVFVYPWVSLPILVISFALVICSLIGIGRG